MRLLILYECLDILYQVNQFVVLFVVVERNNRYTVLQLEVVRVGSVVDQKNCLEVTVFQDTQVLYVDALLRLPAMVAEQPVRNVLLIRVEVVQHHISIALVTCRKHYDLAELRQLFQQLHSMRSDINSSINLFSSGKLNLQTHIIRRLQSLIAVNQGLIQVQHYSVLD